MPTLAPLWSFSLFISFLHSDTRPHLSQRAIVARKEKGFGCRIWEASQKSRGGFRPFKTREHDLRPEKALALIPLGG